MMSIMNKFFDTRKKKFVCGIAVTAIVGLSGISIYAYNSSKSNLLKLKGDSISVEYGQKISLNPELYLDINNLNSEQKSDILKNTVITSSATNEESKEYPSVGEYELTIKYDDQLKKVKIYVKDTTIPVLNVPDSVELVQGTELASYDFKTLMNSTDLAKLNDYVIDISMIDTNKPAEYMAKVSVEDINGNKTEKEFKVIIKSAPQSDEEVVQEKIKNPDGSTSVRTTIKKRQTESNKSSESGGSNNGSSSSNKKNSNSSKSSNNNKTNQNSTSDGRTEINTNKTGETDLGDGGTGESYEGFEWPSDWD